MRGQRADSAPVTSISAPVAQASSGNWLFGIEVLRGVAALSVVFHHSWSLGTMPRFRFYWVLEGFGTWGVALFFLLSGYLLADHFWRGPTRGGLRRYYLRRAFRIGPAYYLNVAILFLFFAEHNLVLSRSGLKQIVANATFTQYLWPTTSSNLNVNGALWTLTIEMLLYLVMPLLAWLTKVTRGLAVVAFIGVGLGYRLFVARAGSGLQSWYFDEGFPDGVARLFLARQFIGILPLFAVGIGVKWLVTQRHLSLRLPAFDAVPRSAQVILALLPSVAFLVFIERAVDFHRWIWFTGYDFVLGLLFVPALLVAASPSQGVPQRVDRPFVWLGERSYGLYLWHFPVILSIYGRGPLLHPADVSPVVVKLAIILVISLSAAAASWTLVEKPAQAYGRRLAARSTA